MTSSTQDPLLVRCARGELVERPPVWLMRQAGRYMADFRKFSEKIPFRERSETPEIAVELSLQPWKAFQTDAVIMFSDILTPLPALGIDFDIRPGQGPRFPDPLRSRDQVASVLDAKNEFQPETKLAFVGEILSNLRREITRETTLIGFVGCPWTLAAYAVEGGNAKALLHTKQFMYNDPDTLKGLLDNLAEMVSQYAIYQIQSGAQVIQLFDSWAHHLSPSDYEEFSIPFTNRVITAVKTVYPDVPIIFFANGGTGKLERIRNSMPQVDVFGVDWSTDIADARAIFGPDAVLQGNLDPAVLFGNESSIRHAIRKCCDKAGAHHILNLGHGVMQGTPEDAVRLLCEEARGLSRVR